MTSDTLACGKCGKVHIAGKVIRAEMDRLGMSSRDLASVLGYRGSSLRVFMAGKKESGCVFAAKWEAWQQTMPKPLIEKWGFRFGERGRKDFIRKDAIQTPLWRFKCIGCETWYWGTKRQKWCLDPVCQRLRRDGIANPEHKWRVEQHGQTEARRLQGDDTAAVETDG